jgi:hypothetical protein
MGMNLDALLYLQRNGWLTRDKSKILDIGPQTIYFVRPEQISEFIAGQGGSTLPQGRLQLEIDRLVRFSTPRAGERTTMLSEIADLTDVDYASIDVCPGLKNTEILDLNFDRLPYRMRRRFDVALNFGTTEHIVNQWNCFKVIHDATKADGIMYHQLPLTGYFDHGYYCYTPLFFEELAKANSYDVLKVAVTPAGENFIDRMGLQTIGGDTILQSDRHLNENNRIPSLNIHVILRKTKDTPFRVLLEISTAHSAPNMRILRRYPHSGMGVPSPVSVWLSKIRSKLKIRSRFRRVVN